MFTESLGREVAEEAFARVKYLTEVIESNEIPNVVMDPTGSIVGAVPGSSSTRLAKPRPGIRPVALPSGMGPTFPGAHVLPFSEQSERLEFCDSYVPDPKVPGVSWEEMGEMGGEHFFVRFHQNDFRFDNFPL